VALVLLVEDEEQVRVLTESYLQAEGHRTLSASTVEQALTLIQGDQPIELLFTDLSLHGDPSAGLFIGFPGR
jgi:CheY-like chemotaxis protein